MYHCLLFSLLFLTACRSKPEIPVAKETSQRPVEVFWMDKELKFLEPCPGKIFPNRYRVLEVNYQHLRKTLLVHGNDGTVRNETITLPLPLPEGGWEEFSMTQVQVMDPALAVKFPEIKTYSGKSKVHPGDQVRLDISPPGVKAMILSTRGTIIIDPYCNNDSLHVISYYKKDLPENAKQQFEK